jgi:hypothetical protein
MVVAFGTEDVWATGMQIYPRGTTSGGSALIEHWDGRTWRIMTDFDTALGGRLWGTAFLSSIDIWGAEYTTGPEGRPTIKHWDGSTWSVVAGPSFGPGGYFVGAMAASAPDDLWAVGNHDPPQQDGHHDEVFSMHWNGSAWSLAPCPSPAGGISALKASVSLTAYPNNPAARNAIKPQAQGKNAR